MRFRLGDGVGEEIDVVLAVGGMECWWWTRLFGGERRPIFEVGMY